MVKSVPVSARSTWSAKLHGWLMFLKRQVWLNVPFKLTWAASRRRVLSGRERRFMPHALRCSDRTGQGGCCAALDGVCGCGGRPSSRWWFAAARSIDGYWRTLDGRAGLQWCAWCCLALWWESEANINHWAMICQLLVDIYFAAAPWLSQSSMDWSYFNSRACVSCMPSYSRDTDFFDFNFKLICHTMS